MSEPVNRVLVFELDDGEETTTEKFYAAPTEPKDYQVWQYTQELGSQGYVSVKLIDSWIGHRE